MRGGGYDIEKAVVTLFTLEAPHAFALYDSMGVISDLWQNKKTGRWVVCPFGCLLKVFEAISESPVLKTGKIQLFVLLKNYDWMQRHVAKH